MRAVVIGNEHGLDAGVVGDRLETDGYDLVPMARERYAEWGAAENVTDEHDLIVLLGSEWHVYDDETREPVDAEIELVRAAARAGVPVLGICFGGQVISSAFGGTVSRVDTPEIGWYDIGLDAGVPIASAPWMQWHYDVFTVPHGFDELARSPVGPQLVVAEGIAGTQFHPEVTVGMIETWLRDGGADQLRSMGRDPDALRAETSAKIGASTDHAAALVDWFLAEVASRR